MIEMDTDALRQLATTAASENETLHTAVNTLNRVTEHDDWNCRERNGINACINDNKKKIRALQEKSDQFLSALRNVVEDFENLETTLSEMASPLESALADALRIPIPRPSAVISNAMASRTHTGHKNDPTDMLSDAMEAARELAADTRQTPPYFTPGYVSFPKPFPVKEIKNMDEPIAVCYFKDIDLK